MTEPTGAGSNGRENESNEREWTASRRRLLRAAAVTGGVIGVGDLALAQETEQIELGGDTSGWVGRSPAGIEGETNPTLELEEGATYEITWENVDGAAHNIAILDADGNELEATEIITGEGGTQTLEFEATRAMAEYYCVVHPNTMRGDVSIGPAGEQEGDDGGDAAAPQFFDEGAEVGVRTVAEGMTAPTDFAVADGDEDRFFVTDQTGEIWVADADGRREEPFLDVSDEMVTLGEFNGQYADPNQDYDERGLLGLEFHPDFAENGRFYVHYSAPPNDETPENWDHVEVVSEFTATDDLESGDPESERRLLEFQSPQYNHAAGPMAFGPDGYLYVPMGDGGGANDDMYGHVDDWYDDNDGGNGQDVSETLLGGVHRIDVDREGDERPYGIPEDNPLVDVEGALDEYYAWGFRNPFGISFDSDGRLFVSDAGQDLFEEANVVEAGGNYGWNVKEGTHCFSTENPGNPPEDCPDSAPDQSPYDGQPLQDPIVEYPHVYEGEMVGITIVGGHVYERDDVPDLEGKYLFGDWTRDPARGEPDGRVFAAAEPEGAAGETEGQTDDGAANGTDGAENESASDGTATEQDGEQVVPRDDLWEMEELVFAGSDDGALHHFVRQFGQGRDGGVYVLANRAGVPEGATGVVMEIVPPGEGESIDVAEGGGLTANGDATDDNESDSTEDEQTGADETEAAAGNETATDETNQTDGEGGNET